jgi:SpoIID/LytB domain protein
MTARATGRRLAAPVALVLALSLLGGPAAGAEEAATGTEPRATAAAPTGRVFTFFGAGWGHGVGMSQFGAYGLALRGWTGQRILEHFYRGTTVGTVDPAPRRIRVGLLQGRDAVQLVAVTAPVQLRVDGRRGPVLVELPVGETWTVRLRSGAYEVTGPDGAPVAGPAAESTLFVVDAGDGAGVSLPQTGHTYSSGWLEVASYEPCPGCRRKLRAVNVLGTQAYLYGVAEVPSSWPEEVLRAQAVAARTYAFQRVATAGQHRPICDCAVYASTLDQVFVGDDKRTAPLGERWVAAVDATRGQVVLEEGQLASTYYHSSSGGYTEDVRNVWGGDAPYLRAVCDPGDYVSANPNREWEVSMSASDIGTRIAAYTGHQVGEVLSFSDIVRGASGRILSLTVNGTLGSAALSGSALRRALGLKDTKVWINSDKNISGTIRATYDRLMCRPGLPTSPERPVPGGSYQAFEVGRIYANDALGRAVWLRGAVLERYLAVGGPEGVLGLPRTGEQRIPGGTRTVFDGGRIYRSEATGAWALHGPVLDRYLSMRGTRGALGFPLTDVFPVGEDRVRARFQGGVITCWPSSGSCRVRLTTGA